MIPALLIASSFGLCTFDDPAAPPALSLAIEGPIDDELAPVAGRFTAEFYRVYPRLIERFEHADRPAPRKVRLVFAPKLRVPGMSGGDTVTVSVDWLRRHPDDVGMLAHELTHLVQRYPPSKYGWMTEGIADLSREEFCHEDRADWSLPTKFRPDDRYSSGYTTTARFLKWLDARKPGSVVALHRQMQEGRFSLESFQEIAGQSIDTLWTECAADLERTVPK